MNCPKIKNIKDIEFFTKGKRGFLYTGSYKGDKVVIKIKNPESKAQNRIENEIKFLEILNRNNIGPKLLLKGKDYFAYRFIEGDFFPKFIQENSKKEILKIVKRIFNQMFILDEIKINKEEMHHPHKHIIINKKDRPVLIDFERCHYTPKPKNVTQFCNYMISTFVSEIFKSKGILLDKSKIIGLEKTYKKDMNKENLTNIIDAIK